MRKQFESYSPARKARNNHMRTSRGNASNYLLVDRWVLTATDPAIARAMRVETSETRREMAVASNLDDFIVSLHRLQHQPNFNQFSDLIVHGFQDGKEIVTDTLITFKNSIPSSGQYAMDPSIARPKVPYYPLSRRR